MALSTENKLYISLAVLAVLGGALFLQNKKEAAEAVSKEKILAGTYKKPWLEKTIAEKTGAA